MQAQQSAIERFDLLWNALTLKCAAPKELVQMAQNPEGIFEKKQTQEEAGSK